VGLFCFLDIYIKNIFWMKKVIRLTESELTELIKNVIVESAEDAADIAELKSIYGSSFIENKQRNEDGFGFYKTSNASGEPVFRATLLGVEPGFQGNGMIYAFIKPVESKTEKETKRNRKRYKSVVMKCGTTGFQARWHRQETLYAPILHDLIQQTYCKFFR
jgi:hypothetical protein